MKLCKLQLENFRNRSSYSLSLPPDCACTVISGDNGRGKTNILEAIYMLSIGRSFRTNNPDDLITWDGEYFRLQAEISQTDENFNLEVAYSRVPLKRKLFKKNEVKISHKNYFGNFLTVLFHPQDLDILYQSPSLRRRYLDILLSQTDRKYFDALSKYNRLLKQRNSLLGQIRANFMPRNELAAWDAQIAVVGEEITRKRSHLISYVNEKITELYQKISHASEEVSVEYKPKINHKEDYALQLQARHDLDILQAKTTLGPHRDDLVFFINGHEIGTSASRGEFRTLMLALKLVEIDYIQDKTGEKPVLLLDDVFSELDLKRQESLISAINSCQSIITTTDAESIHPGIELSANIANL